MDKKDDELIEQLANDLGRQVVVERMTPGKNNNNVSIVISAPKTNELLETVFDGLIKKAKNDNYQPIFKGVFTQNTRKDFTSLILGEELFCDFPSDIKTSSLFILAQPLNTKNNGKFKGKIYEVGGSAAFNGTITPKSVEFEDKRAIGR